jgi:hypothetical protein
MSGRFLIQFLDIKVSCGTDRRGNYCMKPKAIDRTWGMAVLILRFGLNFYAPVEVLSSVALSGVIILSLSLPLAVSSTIWHSGE